MSVYVCACSITLMHMHTSAQRSQKKAPNPLELELHAVWKHLMWVLGTLQEQLVLLTAELRSPFPRGSL